jgi:ACT domain-containing protein
MKIFEIIERFDLIFKLIKAEKTGTANEFAQKIGLSRSQLFNYLDYLKSYEIEIRYDLFKHSYVIENDVEIEIRQPIRILNDKELVIIDGGCSYFSKVLIA